jgi:outer membrane protein assembly factor BamB/predicted phosphodiesterase
MKRFVSCVAVLLFFLALPVFAQQTPFRFAWLSDTHVGSTTGEEDLRITVHDLDTLNNIAFIILSGDITELGWNDQFTLAKSMLDSLNKPYYIIPGNHDTKWSESGCTMFDRIWGSDRFVFEYGGFRFIGLHEGPIMRMGDGHFAPEDLRWLDSVLTAMPDKKQPLIFVTHYPVDPSIDNWFEITDRLKQFNTQVILCGHGHANGKYNFEGIPGVMSRSNLRARHPLGGYSIVDVRIDSMSRINNNDERAGCRTAAFISERTPGVETHTAWDTVVLTTHDYAADTTHYPRPDYSINQKYPNVKTVWTDNTNYTIASAPAVEGNNAAGMVVVGNSSGDVECFSLGDGTKRWTFHTNATVYSTPDIADGRVVFGSSDDNIYCLNINDGKELWKIATHAAVVAVPRIVDGVVYIGGSDGIFRAIELSTGKSKWEFSGIKAFVESKPLVYEGKVIFGSWDGNLYALNIADGSLAWKWSNEKSWLALAPAACWPVAADGKVYIVAPDRFITCLDAASGKEVWRSGKHQVREAIGISNDGSRVYAKCMNDTLFAYSTAASTEQFAWITDCKYGYDIDPSMPQEKDGVVFFGTKNGLVFALDGKSGNILWEHKISNTIVNTVAPIDARRVVVTDFDGKVILLESK